jgi:hypothetical protein
MSSRSFRARLHSDRADRITECKHHSTEILQRHCDSALVAQLSSNAQTLRVKLACSRVFARLERRRADVPYRRGGEQFGKRRATFAQHPSHRPESPERGRQIDAARAHAPMPMPNGCCLSRRPGDRAMRPDSPPSGGAPPARRARGSTRDAARAIDRDRRSRAHARARTGASADQPLDDATVRLGGSFGR